MKRTASLFAPRPLQWFPTPETAVAPLLPYLAPRTVFCEPCAGDGRLIDALEIAGHPCELAFDLHPRRCDVGVGDATKPAHVATVLGTEASCFITNPPWKPRDTLHAIIEALSSVKPAWLLFDADWMHTLQAAPLLPRLRKVVSVGRVKWFADTAHASKDNACWYLFGELRPAAEPVFHGRALRTAQGQELAA